MEGVASTAPEVEAAGSEPDLSPHTGIRWAASDPSDVLSPAFGSGEEPVQAVRVQSHLSPGTCVDGKYIICDVLGTGGSATVYAAEQVGLKRVVAFKLYPLDPSTRPALRERFAREAELLARIQHENVVAVFDSGCLDDGSPYVVVQRLQGQSLAARLLEGPLSVSEAVDVALQVARALTALGAAGITHRDVKPDNLVLEPLPDGRTLVKLVDFGIALSSEAEAAWEAEGLMGTPHYMAPEQVSGGAIDARCDLYALGATFYEMLTGRPPHSAESLQEIVRAVMFAPIAPVRTLRPDCPPELEAIVMRALAREPRQRFASARALKEALERWSAAQGEAAPTDSGVQPEDTLRLPTRLLKRRPRRLSWGLSVAAALALSSLAAWDAARGGPEDAATAATASTGLRESAALELLLQTGPLARGAFVHASAAATEVMAQVQSSTRALLALVRNPAAGWEQQAREQVRPTTSGPAAR